MQKILNCSSVLSIPSAWIFSNMKPIIYISFAILLVQGVCNTVPQESKQLPEPVTCTPESLQPLTSISWQQPLADFLIPSDSIIRKKGLLKVTVQEINNPGLVPVSFSMQFLNDKQQWPLTGFTLYPANNPGVFNVNIAKTVTAMIKSGMAARGTPCHLRIVLDTTGYSQYKQAEWLRIRLCKPLLY